MSLILIIILGALSIAYGFWAYGDVMKRDAGSQRMQEISGAVAEGARAAPGYGLLSAVIRAGCRAAIRVSEKV